MKESAVFAGVHGGPSSQMTITHSALGFSVIDCPLGIKVKAWRDFF
jgi:hypothetical protein